MDGRAVVRGMVQGGVAGAVATAPMTLVMEAGHRMLPRGEQYPLPPREITEQVARSSHIGMPAAEQRRVWLTLAAHFGYGAAAGAVYGALASASETTPAGGARRGVAYGIAVWTVSYLGILPALGLLSPAPEHPRRRSALMIAAHLVWGAAMGMLSVALRGRQDGASGMPARRPR